MNKKNWTWNLQEECNFVFWADVSTKRFWATKRLFISLQTNANKTKLKAYLLLSLTIIFWVVKTGGLLIGGKQNFSNISIVRSIRKGKYFYKKKYFFDKTSFKQSTWQFLETSLQVKLVFNLYCLRNLNLKNYLAYSYSLQAVLNLW